jgi:hypothetical protein
MTVVGLAVLLLIAAGCGAGKATQDSEPEPDPEPPASWATLVRELVVVADYGQIYIFDPNRPPSAAPSTEDDNEALRALDDAYESRRFVGYDPDGFVDVLTPSQYNPRVPVRVEVGEGPPPLDLAAWDHVAEVPLPVLSGELMFMASGSGISKETTVPAGTYRARISGRGFLEDFEEIEGQIRESFRLQLWPAPPSEPKLLKLWPGYKALLAGGD